MANIFVYCAKVQVNDENTFTKEETIKWRRKQTETGRKTEFCLLWKMYDEILRGSSKQPATSHKIYNHRHLPCSALACIKNPTSWFTFKPKYLLFLLSCIFLCICLSLSLSLSLSCTLRSCGVHFFSLFSVHIHLHVA